MPTTQEPLVGTSFTVLAFAVALAVSLSAVGLVLGRRTQRWNRVTPQFGLLYGAVCLATYVLPRTVLGAAPPLSLSELPGLLVYAGGPVAFQGALAIYLFVETGYRSALVGLALATTGLLYVLLLTNGETTTLVVVPRLVGIGSALVLVAVALEAVGRRTLAPTKRR